VDEKKKKMFSAMAEIKTKHRNGIQLESDLLYSRLKSR
jgi:hypothetical protein